MYLVELVFIAARRLSLVTVMGVLLSVAVHRLFIAVTFPAAEPGSGHTGSKSCGPGIAVVVRGL